jgi:hypothetical protein
MQARHTIDITVLLIDKVIKSKYLHRQDRSEELKESCIFILLPLPTTEIRLSMQVTVI